MLSRLSIVRYRRNEGRSQEMGQFLPKVSRHPEQRHHSREESGYAKHGLLDACEPSADQPGIGHGLQPNPGEAEHESHPAPLLLWLDNKCKDTEGGRTMDGYSTGQKLWCCGRSCSGSFGNHLVFGAGVKSLGFVSVWTGLNVELHTAICSMNSYFCLHNSNMSLSCALEA